MGKCYNCMYLKGTSFTFITSLVAAAVSKIIPVCTTMLVQLGETGSLSL